MRKVLMLLATSGLLLAACAEDDPTIGGTGGGETAETGATGPTAAATAADCAAANEAAFLSAGTLTVGTGNPAFPPWWEGGESEDSEFEFNDPANGEGYEGAVVAEVASRLGLTFPDDVTFVQVGFNRSFAPGDKPFDFVLQQISYLPERDEAVDFSESYYDVDQAIVSAKGTAIADATTIDELQDAVLGAPVGTTSLQVIEDVIQPSQDPQVYDDLAGAVQDLKNGAIDGVVADLPTAFFIAAVEIPKGVVVGQFQVPSDEYFAMAFETGSPLVECVNLALQEMKADGTLDAIEQEWLADVTNAPVLT
ncbi:MAG TPA: ABC transporter substrate-binding protein [Actinomycetota bacterium]|jgi:polar amino acid transport system substrate-binding protein|nr:ABC transporter substrate-binding protein [Actinomycetota bacterium]